MAQVDAQGSGQFTWVDYNGAGHVRVEVFRYTKDLGALIKEADVVISHAGGSQTTPLAVSGLLVLISSLGSGSILDVIRVKPLLVVPNSSLMDNHQAQLAEALERQGYLIASTVEQVSKICKHRRGTDTA